MNWFKEWPAEALLAVVERHFPEPAESAEPTEAVASRTSNEALAPPPPGAPPQAPASPVTTVTTAAPSAPGAPAADGDGAEAPLAEAPLSTVGEVLRRCGGRGVLRALPLVHGLAAEVTPDFVRETQQFIGTAQTHPTPSNMLSANPYFLKLFNFMIVTIRLNESLVPGSAA